MNSQTVTANAASQGSPSVQLLADDQFRNARLFKSYDDFEEMPIHSTVLIDKAGVARYVHYGHDMQDIPENAELLALAEEIASAREE